MQLRKESLKKSGLPGLESWPLRYRCSALTDWANKPTGSWSLNWFVIYPGKMKMKLWIYESHIFELRNEEINVKKILAVVNEDRTGIAEVRIRVPASWFFQAFFSQLHKLRWQLRGSSLHLFLHSAVQIYDFHIFTISSSSFPGILRTNLMTSFRLAC